MFLCRCLVHSSFGLGVSNQSITQELACLLSFRDIAVFSFVNGDLSYLLLLNSKGFGFNPGSALLLGDNPNTANVGALCAVNTFLASAAGAISALSLNTFSRYRTTGMFLFDLLGAMNGSLGGLVAITAGCATVEPWCAILIGFVAGAVYLWGSNLLIKCKIDDAVDAVPVHMCNGLWGVIAVGLFSSPSRLLAAYGTDEHPGFFYSLGKDPSDGSINVSGTLLACQVLGALAIMAWTLVLMLPFFYILNYFGWFRSEFEEELIGLDVTYGIVGDVYGEEKKDQYMDAVNRYKKKMREKQFENQLAEFDEEALKRILRVSIKKRSRASSMEAKSQSPQDRSHLSHRSGTIACDEESGETIAEF